MIRRILDRLVAPGIPVLAITAFAVLDTPWPGYVLVAVALVQQLAAHRLDGLGRDGVPRALTIAALIVASTRLDDTGVALAGAMLLAVVALEPRLLTALTTDTISTAHLDVKRGVGRNRLTTRNVYLLATALTVALLVVSALGVGGWIVAGAVALAALGLGAATVASWRGRRHRAHGADTGTIDALVAHQPRFAVHFAAPSGSQYQLSMWLPYFDDLGDEYVIIVRDAEYLPIIAPLTSTPIVVAPSVADLERALVDSIRAVFYVNNSMQNTQCVRFAHLTHVQLMHGDSDKPASYNPISAMYDRIFVAGRAGVDRYHNHGIDIPESRFRIVGHPQAAAVDVRPARRDNPVCLYAPTWTGLSSDVNFCSLPLATAIIEAMLARGVTMIVRPHPYTRRNPAAARQLDAVEKLLAADAERTGRAHLYGRRTSAEMGLVDCINAADVMVCDVSGAASDWLYSERPFAVTDVTGLGESLTAELPLAAAAYRIDAGAANLDEVCEQLLNTDPLAGERAAMKRYYLGEFPHESYRDAFARAARDCYRSEAPSSAVLPKDELLGVLSDGQREAHVSANGGGPDQ